MNSSGTLDATAFASPCATAVIVSSSTRLIGQEGICSSRNSFSVLGGVRTDLSKQRFSSSFFFSDNARFSSASTRSFRHFAHSCRPRPRFLERAVASLDMVPHAVDAVGLSATVALPLFKSMAHSASASLPMIHDALTAASHWMPMGDAVVPADALQLNPIAEACDSFISALDDIVDLEALKNVLTFLTIGTGAVLLVFIFNSDASDPLLIGESLPGIDPTRKGAESVDKLTWRLIYIFLSSVVLIDLIDTYGNL